MFDGRIGEELQIVDVTAIMCIYVSVILLGFQDIILVSEDFTIYEINLMKDDGTNPSLHGSVISSSLASLLTLVQPSISGSVTRSSSPSSMLRLFSTSPWKG